MTTYDNAEPLPEWHATPRCCPFEACDVCGKAEPDGFGGFGVYPLPESIVLGEN